MTPPFAQVVFSVVAGISISAIMQIQTIAFSGRFTSEIRRQLCAKRKSLGLSLQQLSRFLRVSWATIRKWECGEARSCTAKYIPLIGAFLQGEYDASLREMADTGNPPALAALRNPPAVQECLTKIASAYELCEDNAPLQHELLEGIHLLTREAIRQFLRERAISARPSSRR